MSESHLTSAFLNYAPAAERNAEPLIEQLSRLLDRDSRVFEIGSGSGQHAVCFTHALEGVVWQASEVFEGLAALQHNLSDFIGERLLNPVELNVRSASHWSNPAPCNTVFSANTLHIISWPAVEDLFAGVAQLLPEGGRLITYGPYRYNGEYTSASNADFDDWLQARDPDSGIRDVTALRSLAAAYDLKLKKDITMPANNQLLVWKKTGE